MTVYNVDVNNRTDNRRVGDAFDTVLNADHPRRVRRDWRVGGRTVFTETVTGRYTPARKVRALAAWNEWKRAA